jgi:hypothetical protein
MAPEPHLMFGCENDVFSAGIRRCDDGGELGFSVMFDIFHSETSV